MAIGVVMAALALVLAALHNFGSTLDKVGTRGQFITCVAFACALVLLHGRDQWLMSRRLVRSLAFVGIFSYSLYLTHELAQGVVLQLFKRFAALDTGTFAYAFWVQVVLPIPCAFAFFWLFERPFLSRSSRRLRGAVAAPQEPAPIQIPAQEPVPVAAAATIAS